MSGREMYTLYLFEKPGGEEYVVMVKEHEVDADELTRPGFSLAHVAEVEVVSGNLNFFPLEVELEAK